MSYANLCCYVFKCSIRLLGINGLTLFSPMEFSIKSTYKNSGWSIVYIKGSQVIISKTYCISFFVYRYCLNKQCRLMKYHTMEHFICVFTVHQSTFLVVCGLQRV